MLRRIFITLALLIAVAPLQAQTGWTPEPTGRLVNDYSGVLGDTRVAQLEQRLVAFNDSTSNQILIVITPTLGGDEEQATAQRIGEQWGVGQQKFDNGVVILIKSKTAEENWGAVAIATGYGVEGVLPDVFCKHIIEDEMIGPLGEGDYYRAVVRALDIIEPALAGEYSYAQYSADNRRAGLISLVVFIAIAVLVCWLLYRYNKNHPGGPTGGGTYFGGPAGGSFWGSGSSFGGSSFGGGFGGFGGGSFGGGGASGRF